MRSPESSIKIVQSILVIDVWLQENDDEVTVDVHATDTSDTSIAVSSVTTIVVSVIAALSNLVGAVIVITGASVSITYD